MGQCVVIVRYPLFIFVLKLSYYMQETHLIRVVQYLCVTHCPPGCIRTYPSLSDGLYRQGHWVLYVFYPTPIPSPFFFPIGRFLSSYTFPTSVLHNFYIHLVVPTTPPSRVVFGERSLWNLREVP